jgi:hypothetical protein
MNESLVNNTYGAADSMWQARNRGGNAGQRPAEMVGERAPTPIPAPPRPRVAAVSSGARRQAARRSDCAADSATPLRLVQVYMTPGIDEFLREARSMAIMQNRDVTASAVVRYAMERLMAAASPAEMVGLLGSPKGQSQAKRGRPRR